MDNCTHPPEGIIDDGYAESTREIHPGYFQITRARQTKCTACGMLFNNQIDLDAIGSNRSVDGFYGVNYEEI